MFGHLGPNNVHVVCVQDLRTEQPCFVLIRHGYRVALLDVGMLKNCLRSTRTQMLSRESQASPGQPWEAGGPDNAKPVSSCHRVKYFSLSRGTFSVMRFKQDLQISKQPFIHVSLFFSQDINQRGSCMKNLKEFWTPFGNFLVSPKWFWNMKVKGGPMHGAKISMAPREEIDMHVRAALWKRKCKSQITKALPCVARWSQLWETHGNWIRLKGRF